MKLKKMTGYMLGNPANVNSVGCAWANVDSRVWVCATLDKAKRVLRESQQNMIGPGCVWTTIYQVSAHDIVCEKTYDGLWYTNTPTKICVDRVVFHKDVRQITDADLLVNARKQHGQFARLMLSLQQGDVR